MLKIDLTTDLITDLTTDLTTFEKLSNLSYFS